MENMKHILSLENQQKLSICGVMGIDSMSDKEVEVLLPTSKIVIRGEGLNVSKLNVEEGNLLISGQKIQSIVYMDKAKGKMSLAKLFK